MTKKKITIEEFRVGNENEIETLIKRVFDEYIGPDYSREGVDTFLEYSSADKIRERYSKDNFKLLVAKDGNTIIGIIEVRDNMHICLLFVDKHYQRQGIATRLFESAFNDLSKDITVNSSPYAASIYERLGFNKIAGEMINNGITYIPMIRQVNNNK